MDTYSFVNRPLFNTDITSLQILVQLTDKNTGVRLMQFSHISPVLQLILNSVVSNLFHNSFAIMTISRHGITFVNPSAYKYSQHQVL